MFLSFAITRVFSGFILGKKSAEEEANASNFDCWKTNATFQNVTVWNHDAMPSKDDAVLRAFHWFSVATAVSSHFLFFEPRGGGSI